MASDALCGAAAFARFALAKVTVAVARARSAGATVDWVAVEALNAALTVGPFSEMEAGLGADIAFLTGQTGTTRAMAVALALGTGGEEPARGRTPL